MKYNNEQSRGSPGGSPGGSLEVRALTYNLSWASQKKAIAGSEADFVERCITINRDCYKKALIKIQKLHYAYKFHVIGIQEVEDPDLVSSIDTKLSSASSRLLLTSASFVGIEII